MMIDLQKTLENYGVIPRGIVHIGAHKAQEHDDYVKMGANYIVYVEPMKEAFNYLLERFGGKRDADHNGCHVCLYNYACAEKYMGFVEMNVSDNNEGQSNSLLEPGLHLIQHPDVVFTKKELVEVQSADNMLFERERCNIFVADVQGYELEVLKGSVGILKYCDAVYLEVNRGETYIGNALIEDIDYFLLKNDFERVETFWPSPNLTWGDAIYISRKFLK